MLYCTVLYRRTYTAISQINECFDCIDFWNTARQIGSRDRWIECKRERERDKEIGWILSFEWWALQYMNLYVCQMFVSWRANPIDTLLLYWNVNSHSFVLHQIGFRIICSLLFARGKRQNVILNNCFLFTRVLLVSKRKRKTKNSENNRKSLSKCHRHSNYVKSTSVPVIFTNWWIWQRMPWRRTVSWMSL